MTAEDWRNMSAPTTANRLARRTTRTGAATAAEASDPAYVPIVPTAARITASGTRAVPPRIWLIAVAAALTPMMTSDAVVASCGGIPTT